MSTEFNPDNPIVRLCMQGMRLEEQGKLEEVAVLFLQGWDEAANDFERCLIAWFTARVQLNASERIAWYEKALELAETVSDDAVQSAFPSLHNNLSKGYEEVGDLEKAAMHQELARLTLMLKAACGFVRNSRSSSWGVKPFLFSKGIKSFRMQVYGLKFPPPASPTLYQPESWDTNTR